MKMISDIIFVVIGSISLCLFPIYIGLVLFVLRSRLGEGATVIAFLGPFAGLFIGLVMGWWVLGVDAIIFAGLIGICVGLAAGLHIANKGIWVRNALVAVVGLIFILVVARTINLTCKRVEPKLPVTCKFTKSRLLWTTVREFELHGAKVRVTETEDQGTRTTLLLQTSEGEMRDIPIGLFTSKQSFASRINSYVKNPEGTPLTYQYDNRMFYYVIGTIFILVSLHLMVDVFDRIQMILQRTLKVKLKGIKR